MNSTEGPPQEQIDRLFQTLKSNSNVTTTELKKTFAKAGEPPKSDEVCGWLEQ